MNRPFVDDYIDGVITLDDLYEIEDDSLKDALPELIQYHFDTNRSIDELLEIVKEVFSNDDYFSTACRRSRRLIKLMMKTYLDINEGNLYNNEKRLYEVVVPFLEYANNNYESNIEVVLSTIGELYTGEVLASYLLFHRVFSWKIASQLYSVADFDIELGWIRHYADVYELDGEEAIRKLHYLRNGDV